MVYGNTVFLPVMVPFVGKARAPQSIAVQKESMQYLNKFETSSTTERLFQCHLKIQHIY
jgi:hypothetical protein